VSGIMLEGYVSLREAIWTIAETKCAGRPFAEAVAQARSQGWSIFYDEYEQKAAAEAFWRAVDNGHLSVRAVHPASGRMRIVEAERTGSVPFLRHHRGGDLTMLRAANPVYLDFVRWFGCPPYELELLVDMNELHQCCARIRINRKRRAREGAGRTSPGRPSHIPEIKAVLQQLAEEGREIAGTIQLKAFSNLVNEKLKPLTVSDRSVGRALDELYKETGERRFLRLRKRRRTGARAATAVPAGKDPAVHAAVGDERPPPTLCDVPRAR
jgi:hypothetical protein